MTVSTRFLTVTLLLVSALLLTCHSAVTVVEVGVADDSIDPLDASVAMNAPCKKLRSEFSPLVMLYGREVVSSTKDSSAIVLLSDLSWGVVQYLKQCEPHVFSPLNTTGDGSDGGDSNGSRTTSRYLHLFHQEPHYPDISWPVRDSSFTSSQLLADFMQANTPDVEDFEEGDIDDVFPTILVEFSLLSTTDFKFDGTWLGVYSYVPLGFVCELSAQKTQWKHSYQKHAESMAHLGSLQRTFSFFQPIDVNKRADEAEVRLQNFKKMSKRKQKKTSASYSRRYVTSVFQQNDVSQTRAIPGAGDIPFLKAFPVNSVEFAIARQYTDAHTELAMHMITSSLSVSKEIAALNSEFDYFQCARTLDRLLLACDLLTHAVETLSRFSEDVHGEGTYESLKTLFSKGLVPSSTNVFSLLKNLITAVDSSVERVGFFVRSPGKYNSSELFLDENIPVEDTLILVSDFSNGSILNVSFLEMMRSYMINVVENYTRLAKGLPESEVERYKRLIQRAEDDLENRPEAVAAERRRADIVSNKPTDGIHIEL